jgi:hypothetical protein
MMKYFLAALLILLVLVLGGGVSLYVALPFIVKPDSIQKKIVQGIEEITENEFVFRDSDTTYFPFLRMEFHDLTLDWNGQPRLHLSAKKMKIYLRIFDLLFGRIKVSRLQVEGGVVTLVPLSGALEKPFEIKEVQLAMEPLGTGVPIKFVLSGHMLGIPKSLSAHGTIAFLDEPGKQDWASTVLEGEAAIRHLNLVRVKNRLPWNLPLNIRGGELNGKIEFHKKKGETGIELAGKTDLRHFIYQLRDEKKVLTSTKIQLGMSFNLMWDPNTEELLIQSMSGTSPIGNVEATGRLSLGTGEIQEMRVAGSGIVLQSIPEYWISLKEALPFNLGFSGQSDFEISLEGTWDHLSLDANIDLTPAILTYARFFSKPRDLPLTITFDYLIRDRQMLSGDFSVNFRETIVKGTFTDFNLIAGEGQLNVITNKFSLSGYQSLLLPFQNYDLQGEVKILANWNGNFRQPGAVKNIFNLTLENGNFMRRDGPAIRNVNVALDYGPMGLIVKKAGFEIADSPISAEVSIYNIFERPIVNAKISAARLEPFTVLAAFEDWILEWLSPEAIARVENAKRVLKDFFPPGESAENVVGEFEYRDGKWGVNHLEFDAYGDKSKWQGKMEILPEISKYELNVEIDRLSLARFLTRGGGNEEGPMEGNLFLKMRLAGEKSKHQSWAEALEGEGTFIVTNGQFKSFDVLRTIGGITELKGTSRYASGSTPFHDVHAPFVLKNKKVSTEKLALVASNLSLEASGEAALDLNLNYRLNVFLSPRLTRELMEPLFGQSTLIEGKQLGPIPLLLSGPLAKPEVQPDPKLIPQVIEQLTKKKPQKILRNFLPEEALFDRRKSS